MEKLYDLFQKSTGIQTDSRGELKGKLFFCLKGANFDGNQFAEEAFRKGAIAVVIDNSSYAHLTGTYLVDDSLKCLQQLANFHRKQFSIPIIGITGSNGKTTSKELIATVLQTTYSTHFTNGNLNNHIGVPLTLLQLKHSHDIAVIEMGANKPGDIQELVEIAEPTHGIITNVGRAHLEGFGSLEGVIKTKTEMYRFIEKNNGTLFVHSDNATLMQQSNLLNCKKVFYGNEGSVSGRLVELTPFVKMKWNEENYSSPQIATHLIGEYNFINFLAAICIGRHFNVSTENCDLAISNYQPTNNRSQVTKTEFNTLIVDCYNANPTSMESALSSFSQINEDHKLVILGDMREMGQDAEMVHKEVLDQLKNLQLKGFLVGDEFYKYKDSYPEFAFIPSTEPLIRYLIQHPIKNTTILLKGSRGIALEKLIPKL